MWYAISFVLAVAVALLAWYLLQLKRAAREIADAFAERVADASGTAVGVSSRDPDLCRLTASLNRELRELQQVRLRCERSETDLNRAVANLSHDLRTPLTAISGYLTLLQETDDAAEREQYIRVLSERTEVMKQLAEELLQYAKLVSPETAGEAVPTAVDTVLTESIAGAYPLLSERGIVPEVNLPKERVVRTANRAELSRMFGNLLTNAVRYSDGDLTVTLSENGDVSFANKASGLDAVLAEQLFDRFFTVEAGGRGMGLGLSIVRSLAERMGGSAEARYADGRLVVTVHLPENRA
ncbi:MAG: HAMP domain-containing histidine kinase [Lachnospiraceae bacterium]|nr:HAMP domain-containing histidine kinase [Lachnospiraceae bacterium]